MSLYAVCVWIHVVAAASWVGSMVFFSVVLVPVFRREDVRRAMPDFVVRLGQRYRAFGWTTLAILVVTGAANLRFRGIGWSDLSATRFWATPFGQALGWKMLFVAVVLVLTAVHDAASRRRFAPGADGEWSPGDTLRARRTASSLGRLVLVTSLAILFFATALVRGF